MIRTNSGFSLVETMIGIAISSIIILCVYQVFSNSEIYSKALDISVERTRVSMIVEQNFSCSQSKLLFPEACKNALTNQADTLVELYDHDGNILAKKPTTPDDFMEIENFYLYASCKKCDECNKGVRLELYAAQKNVIDQKNYRTVTQAIKNSSWQSVYGSSYSYGLGCDL